MLLRKKSIIGVILLACIILGIYMTTEGYLGDHRGPGEVTKKPIPKIIVEKRQNLQKQAGEKIGIKKSKQILFGDLHVHTTFSMDAFLFSLPVVQGEGAHPPADACDYARFCSALDFWSINDHAESLDPRRWNEMKESIRQCNAVTNPDNPDVVAFLGYEWTNIDFFNKDTHYGHKNVIFRDTEEAKVPARPIFSKGRSVARSFAPPFIQRIGMPFMDFPKRDQYLDHNRYVREMYSSEECPEGVHTLELPADCREGAADPVELFAKLNEGGFESIVIPHGNTWGIYTPPGSEWDKQLKGPMHDPKQQIMVEVFSGHGNSEEYRDFRAVTFNEKGEPECPEATTEFLPACRRAGQIIKERCLAEGESEDECLAREIEAMDNFFKTAFGLATVPGAPVDDWLDSDQCKDCFLPAFNYRPGGSSQYALAISNFDDPENVRRFKFGFMASSDNHTARPGTGYKEIDRRENTEATGPRDKFILDIITGRISETESKSRYISPDDQDPRLIYNRAERGTSFLLTGGLIATHSKGRDRNSIWDSFQRKEVYGTSGDRILLWFDLINGPGENDTTSVKPMGSELTMDETPRFRVRAVGAFKQEPGCPDYSMNSISRERLNHLCRNECYNPSDERKLITRIEIIRIRPQIHKDENVKDLIEDIWLSHPCVPDPNGCSFEFTDQDFQTAKRDTVYYVRAIQEPSDTVNAENLRCKYDDKGNCIETNQCYGDYRTEYQDDCIGKAEERAWSSPIFVDY